MLKHNLRRPPDLWFCRPMATDDPQRPIIRPINPEDQDQALALLVRQGVVTQGVALDRCRSEEDFRNHLHGT